jgi:hypothetical protein
MQWQVRELSVVRRVSPSYPSDVSAADAGDVACRASVRIAGDGVPADVLVDGCPLPFARETQRAIGEWRWAAWGSVAERRVTLSVRFPRPTRLGVTAPLPASVAAGPVAGPALPSVPAATPASYAVPAAPAAPLGPVIPSYADALAHGAPARTGADGIVCSAEIVRNRHGGAVKASLGACPADYRDAAEEALKELRRQPGRRAGADAPSRRLQSVKITFQVSDA